jgi:hypothetical protein
MCQQIKMGFMQCPHVARDLYIMSCHLASSKKECDFTRTGMPDLAWLETKEIGKCHFSMLEEQGEMERLWRRKQILKRLDLDEDK